MAKSDSFFIRATVDFDGTTFQQTAIDLGAYVDALGKSVLRIHNIAVQYGTPLQEPATATTSAKMCAGYALTTQSQSALVDANDKSLIASGKLTLYTDGTGAVTYTDDSTDVSPQHWTNGYLVGVEQIYLGADTNSADNLSLNSVQIVLECTVETLSQSAAMALALSQQ